MLVWWWDVFLSLFLRVAPNGRCRCIYTVILPDLRLLVIGLSDEAGRAGGDRLLVTLDHMMPISQK